MALSISLREATLEDVPEMIEVLQSAFTTSILNDRCYPPEDPETQTYWTGWCNKNINDPNSHILVAEEAPQGPDGPKRILGWTRWYPRKASEPDAPRVIVSRDGFPASGDPDLGVRFFQGNIDVMREVLAGMSVWYLSMLVVRKDVQRRGVGGMMMRYGCEKADEVGWKCAVNGSAEGKGLYEKHGFRTVRRNDYGDGIVAHAMLRDVNGAV